MSRRRICCALVVVVAGCTTPARDDSSAAPVSSPAAWGAPDAEPLSVRQRAPSAAELLDYQQFWCARKRSARILRRLRLEAPTDALELLLLDYCDEARSSPRRLEQRLADVVASADWPADSRGYLDWLRWHLQNFAQAADEAAARERRLRGTLDQLRAIEHDVNSRDIDTETPP